MDLATQTHLTTLRELLNFRLHELRADVHAAEQVRRASGDAHAQEVSDRKDEAAQQQRSDLDATQEARDIAEMAAVEAALHRLDAGTFGDCAACGEPIPIQRLMVQPAALCCAPCQAQAEHARIRSR